MASFSGAIWMFPKIVGFPPKSSILIGFSITNHPFWGTPIFGKHPCISFGQHNLEWLVHRGHSQVPWNPRRSATNWQRKFTAGSHKWRWIQDLPFHFRLIFRFYVNFQDTSLSCLRCHCHKWSIKPFCVRNLCVLVCCKIDSQIGRPNFEEWPYSNKILYIRYSNVMVFMYVNKIHI